MTKFACVFLCLVFFYPMFSRTEVPLDTLQMVHILYRHGDRAPISFYKNDPYKNISDSIWPEGLGQLTIRGKTMEYNLGKWLRARYTVFIDSVFDSEQVNIISTDFDRTLMSAECVLASFFYPMKSLRFNEKVLWTPTPVHTSPKGKDTLLNVDSSCPRIADEVEIANHLPEVEAFVDQRRELFNFLAEKSGSPMDSIDDVEYLYDTLMIERLYNLTLPDWAEDNMDDMKEVADFFFELCTYTMELKRLRGGPLLERINNNMQLKSAGTLTRRLEMFSAHDMTVAILLGTIEAFNNLTPPYAATILIELHQVDGDYFVKTFYQNDSALANAPHPVVIPGCVEACPLDRWVSLLEDVIPSNWNRECYRPDPARINIYIMVLTGLCALLAGVGIVVLVSWGRGWCRPYSRSRFESAYEPLPKESKRCYGSVDNSMEDFVH